MSDLIPTRSGTYRCACRFKSSSGEPVQYCAHHATKRDEIERLNALVALQKKDMKQAMDEIERLTAEMRFWDAHWTEKCKRLQNVIDRLQNQREISNQLLTDKCDELKRLTAENESVREMYVAKVKDCRDLQAKVETLEGVLNELRNRRGKSRLSELAATEQEESK